MAPSVGPPVTGCGEKRLRIRLAASRHGAQRSVGCEAVENPGRCWRKLWFGPPSAWGSQMWRYPGSTAVDAAFMQLADRPARLCVAHAA